MYNIDNSSFPNEFRKSESLYDLETIKRIQLKMSKKNRIKPIIIHFF